MNLTSVIVLSAAITCVLGGIISDHGYEDYDHHAPIHHIVLPPAISTFSFVSLNHHKPTSYSGFTNHGRGHHDPGYAVQFRQDGYLPHHENHIY